MAFKLYNTLTRKKEVFKPIEKGKVGLYCCGPTVYWHQHIGNLRTYIFEDVLKRVLMYNRFKVMHVINVTDVGHLTSDADVGEDKLLKALKREGLPLTKEAMLKLADKYFDEFKQDFEKLHILMPDVWCKATEHIPEMIELIEKIEKNTYTYTTNVGLIFDTSKFKDYAKLGRLNLEEIKEGARGKEDPERKHPSDFALWITNQPNHIMLWDSPWGKGFPGWHLECAAMSMKYLGDQFDIHCGGKEHIQVHHTNEITEAEAATGKKWVNYWLHAEWLVVPKGKMSKSKGEFFTISDLIEKGYDPLAYRYFCYTAHYRTPLTFSWEALDSAKIAYENFKNRIIEMKEDLVSKPKDNKYQEQFTAAVNDDLNIPVAMSVVWNLIKEKDLGNKEKYDLLLDFDKVLGFDIRGFKRVEISEDIQKLVDEREAARKAKDFKKADEIRDKLKEMGIVLEDTPQGVRWKRA
ncbi:cysteine--tRNA ligase [Candidatus Woesearchaeota archaeon]|nr:cysteine--tRNA ligase [Candidatus Woesearchaeota archaeon]